MLYISFATTIRELNHDLLLMNLYEKAKGATLYEINRVARETEAA